MPITGKFIADFTAFNDAVKKAGVELTGMETNANKVGTSLNRMVDQFSGRKVIQESQLMVQAFELLASKGIGLTTKELQRMGDVAEEAMAKLKAGGEQIPPGLQKIADAASATRQQLENQNKAAEGGALSFGKLFSSFTAANLAATAIQKLTGSVGELIDRGQKLPGIESSFERLSKSIGQDSAAMVATLQGATKGLVGEMELMQTANKAMLLGLPVTIESMGEMAQAATALGRAMGKDATSSIDDMITGLARMSPQILDNLGLTVKLEEANEHYAAKLGIAAEQLTEAQRKTAFYEEAMEKARKKSKELGDQSLTLGEILKSIWVTALDHATRYAAFVNKEGGKILSQRADPSGRESPFADQAAANRFKIVADQMDAAVRSGEALTATGVAMATAWGNVDNRVTVTGKTFDSIGRPIKDATGALNLQKLSAEDLEVVYKELARTYQRTTKEIGDSAEATKAAAQAQREATALLAEVTVAEYKAIVKTIQDYEANVVKASRTTTANVTAMGVVYKNFGKDVAEMIRVLGIKKLDPEAIILPNIPYIDFEGIKRGLDGVTEHEKAADAASRALTQSLNSLATSLANLSEIGGGLGTVAKELATFVSAAATTQSSISGMKVGLAHLGDAKKAGEVASAFVEIGASAASMASAFLQATETGNTLQKTLKGAALGAQIGSQFGGIGALIGAGIGAQAGFLRGIFGKDEGRKAVEDFAKGMGGFDAIQKQLAIVGKEGEAAWAAFTRARGTEQAKAGIDAVTKALGNVPKALNDMVRAATIAGGGLQASMVPYIQSLIEAGQLTEANANLLLGLPEAGVPSFDAVAKAAERLGLNIDSIGQSVKQMGFTEAVSMVASDLDILARAGADMDAVLTGSRDKIQKLVDDAQKFGFSLPESIKPFLQQMVDSGKLTDIFGEKLGDLEDLHFEKPLEKSVDELVKAMKELVDVIKNDVGGALDDLGKKVIKPRIEMPSADAIRAGGGGAMTFNNKTTVMIDGEVVGEAVAREAMRP